MNLETLCLQISGIIDTLEDNTVLLNNLVYGYFSKYSDDHEAHQEEITTEFPHNAAYVRIFENSYNEVLMQLSDILEDIERSTKLIQKVTHKKENARAV